MSETMENLNKDGSQVEELPSEDGDQNSVQQVPEQKKEAQDEPQMVGPPAEPAQEAKNESSTPQQLE